ncbi:hypothetical protein [Ancylobacter lacus]|uniref:hypothetical protein n=1 Tax=Ancylobacter lacus TaxID=2579970 RepID=UPI001BCD060F|nr:hypothetical protein [Ancylobacter lacus]MBS7540270.1 hypothetical protein [Ancylobacter lacus]
MTDESKTGRHSLGVARRHRAARPLALAGALAATLLAAACSRMPDAPPPPPGISDTYPTFGTPPRGDKEPPVLDATQVSKVQSSLESQGTGQAKAIQSRIEADAKKQDGSDQGSTTGQ